MRYPQLMGIRGVCRLCLAAWVIILSGCSPRDDTQKGGDVDYIYEASKEPHAIGYDHTGMPVYGVDSDGNPRYKPEEK